MIDLRTRRIPNALTGALAVIGVGIAAAKLGPIGLGGALLGCALGLAFMLPGHVFGATGAGDVKLFAAAGALLGPATTVQAFLYTAIVGGVLAVAIAIRRRRLRQTIGATARLVSRDLRVLPQLSHPRWTTASRMHRRSRSVSSWRRCCDDDEGRSVSRSA